MNRMNARLILLPQEDLLRKHPQCLKFERVHGPFDLKSKVQGVNELNVMSILMFGI